LTPLIDVIFILLIFFAVSTSFVVKQEGIELKLPEVATSDSTPKGVVVSIDAGGLVYLDKQVTDIVALRSAIVGLIEQNPNLQVILQAHQTTSYDSVMTVLDTVRLGGCYNIVLEAKRLSIKE
jgi:biopolymer transport protein ExbD